MMASLDVSPDAAIAHIITSANDDLAILHRLRLARRNCMKREKEYHRAMRRMIKARRKLDTLLDECEAHYRDSLDPKALE